MNDISRSIPKTDSVEKMEGRARYTDDYRYEGLLYARTLRSEVAHGVIESIELPDLPEGYTVVSSEDIQGENVVNMIFDDWPVFAEKEVHHIGEPILLIVGPDKATIRELIKNTKVHIKALPATFDYTDSVVHKSFIKGDPEKAFKDADEKIEKTYETGYQEQAYIEPQGFLGYKEYEGVTLVGSIQCPYYVKEAVKRTTGLDDFLVRIIQAEVGGAFGGKEEFPSLMACQLAVAIQKTGRPIKLIYDRPEDMEVTTKRHPSKTRMEAALSKKGDLLGLRVHVGIDGGAYIGLSGVVLSRAMIAVSGAYTIDHLDVKGDVYRTDTVPNGAFRGFGAPQMLFAIEMFMHHIAKHLGKEPDEFREAYLARQGDKTSTSGTFKDPIIMPAMIRRAKELSDYDEKKKTYNHKEVYKGIGMSWFLHGCGFTGSGEADIIKARVRLHKDAHDEVHILIAAVDMGQGPKTTIRKVVANVLEMPIEKVHYPNPDTKDVPDSGPTVASRTAMIVGGLCARAAKELRETFKPGEAQDVYEDYVQPEGIKWDEESMQGDAYPAYSWGVNIVEVEVDKATYEIDIKHVTSVYDVGKSLDDRIIKGQIDGGQAQGLGYGSLEVMTHKDGKIRQNGYTDYIIPTSVDAPPMTSEVMDNPYALGPYGAKGAGELTLVGGAPALAKAVEQAIGTPVTKIPITPESILEMIDNG
ncbi:MAG: xanthine dehydrogenase family protein molybdopterin-binding subunit [Candidatus Izemoplasmataceae bacterium]